MLWTPVPPALTLGEGEEDRTWEFLTVVGGSQAEARACLSEALELQARGALYPTHAQAWAQLWAGCGLDVVGPLALRQALRGALYYLLSALPEPGVPGYVCHGLSPGGLSNGSREECYWGHVFWDQVCTRRPGTHLHGGGVGGTQAEGPWAQDMAWPGMGAVAGEAQGPWQPGRLPGGGGSSAGGCVGVCRESSSGEGTGRHKAPELERAWHLARAGGGAHAAGRAVVGGLRAP